jgi:hypothetical protein
MPRAFPSAAALFFASLLALSAAAEDKSSGLQAAFQEPFDLGDYTYCITDAFVSNRVGGAYLGQSPEENARYVIVQFTIRNNTKGTKEVLADDFKLQDSQDRVFTIDSDANIYVGHDFLLRELQPGITKKARCVFQIPVEALDGRLQLIVPKKQLFSSDFVFIQIRLKNHAAPVTGTSIDLRETPVASPTATGVFEAVVVPSSPHAELKQKTEPALIFELDRALNDHDWQTVTTYVADGVTSYFGHQNASVSFIEKDIQGDAKTYKWTRTSPNRSTFRRSVKDGIVYESVEEQTEALEFNGRHHRAYCIFLISYKDADPPVVLSLSLKVLK